MSERTQRQIDRLLDAAEEAFGRGDWAALRDGAEKTLLLDPENGRRGASTTTPDLF